MRRLFSRSAQLPSLVQRLTNVAPDPRVTPIPILQDGSLDSFRSQCWKPEAPAVLPRPIVAGLPALTKWFASSNHHDGATELNWDLFRRHGHTIVPLEWTRQASESPNDQTFRRVEAPLALFLDWARTQTPDSIDRIYLGQASISALPSSLRDDLPTPDIVAHAGRGDIYDANLWMGVAPTYTPLHRDPNPNLFVQLAGKKVVRLVEPRHGADIFRLLQEQLGRQGSFAFRGEEMMQGEERELLESMIWDDKKAILGSEYTGYEAQLDRGDGLFIPKGWWHSIKGVGEGITASVGAVILHCLILSLLTTLFSQVNWWFR